MNSLTAHSDCLLLQRGFKKLVACRGVALAAGMAIVGLLSLFLLFHPVQAQDFTNSPDAPGSISGKVTNEQGSPLAGINVYVCSNRYYPYDPYACIVNSNEPARTVTQADGSYKVAGLGAATYQLRFVDPQRVYASEFYNDALELTKATGIPVSGNNRTGINVSLALGGSISGTITSITGTMLNNVSVSVYLSGSNPLNGLANAISTQSLDFDEREYVVGGLPTAEYYVCASGYIAASYYSYLTECYDDQIVDSTALLTVPVQSGQTTPDIDFVLGQNALYGQITGRITASNGDPVPYANVSAGAEAPWYTRFYSTSSDENGYYTFTSVISDVYTVVASHYLYGDFVTYYGNVSDPAEATSFALPGGTKKSDVNITMIDGGVIQGNIILYGDLIPQYGEVTLYRNYADYAGSDYNYWSYFRTVPIDTLTGEYFVRGLPDGTYRLSVYGSFDGFYFSKYYRDDGTEVYSVEEASNVVISSEAPVANVDFVINQKFYEGSIKGLVGADGTPLEGIQVNLYDSFYYGGYYAQSPLVYTFTDAQGFYRFDGLNDGYYTVGFIDPAGNYASTFYNGMVDPSGFNAIPVFDGQHVFGINASMSLGGAIAGTVKGPNGEPLPDVSVTVYTMTPYLFVAPLSTQVKTDENGNYRVGGLSGGLYRVCFQESSALATTLCYGGATSPWDARDVTVEVGATTSGIDLILGTLDLPNKLYLPVGVKDSTPFPVSPVPVEAIPAPLVTPTPVAP